jgi:2-haloacid dehalogenase
VNKPAAVVFDLGGVLIRWDPRPAIAAGVGLEQADAFLGADDFDFAAWNYEQDAGRTWEAAEALVADSHPHWHPHATAYRSNFDASMLGAHEDTVAVLRDLHAAGVPLFALTNWSAELFPRALERFDFLGLFDEIVVSGEVGLAKPDPAIFATLADRIGVPLSQCVFVDDVARNVEAAAAAGLDAIRFSDTGHLRTDLRERGLPV